MPDLSPACCLLFLFAGQSGAVCKYAGVSPAILDFSNAQGSAAFWWLMRNSSHRDSPQKTHSFCSGTLDLEKKKKNKQHKLHATADCHWEGKGVSMISKMSQYEQVFVPQMTWLAEDMGATVRYPALALPFWHLWREQKYSFIFLHLLPKIAITTS